MGIMESTKRAYWDRVIPISIALLTSLVLVVPFWLQSFKSAEQKPAPPLQRIDNTAKSDQQCSNQASEHVPVQIALTPFGNFGRNKEFTVTAYVKDPKEGQSVLLHLPDGFALINSNESMEKRLCAARKGDYTTVSWKVTGIEYGLKIIQAELRANNQTIEKTHYDVVIRMPCHFNYWPDE